jgi:peptidyl-prolyl cis-trans isomerase A (cyclophilin A)
MAMANRGPNTGTSQFFITERPTPALDDGGGAGGHYQIFGDCPDKNVELVKKIAATPRDPGDRPTQEVKIVKVTIKRETAPTTTSSAVEAGKGPGKGKAEPAKPTNDKKLTQPNKKVPPPG